MELKKKEKRLKKVHKYNQMIITGALSQIMPLALAKTILTLHCGKRTGYVKLCKANWQHISFSETPFSLQSYCTSIF